MPLKSQKANFIIFGPNFGYLSPEEKEMFYTKLDSVLDQCPRHDALIAQGDFNAVTGTERAGYEICVGPHGSSGDRTVRYWTFCYRLSRYRTIGY